MAGGIGNRKRSAESGKETAADIVLQGIPPRFYNLAKFLRMGQLHLPGFCRIDNNRLESLRSHDGTESAPGGVPRWIAEDIRKGDRSPFVFSLPGNSGR